MIKFPVLILVLMGNIAWLLNPFACCPRMSGTPVCDSQTSQAVRPCQKMNVVEIIATESKPFTGHNWSELMTVQCSSARLPIAILTRESLLLDGASGKPNVISVNIPQPQGEFKDTGKTPVLLSLPLVFSDQHINIIERFREIQKPVSILIFPRKQPPRRH